MTRTLLLTPWYSPHDVLCWQDAVTMKWEGKANVLHEYEDTVSSTSLVWNIPSVMILKELQYLKKRGVKFSRQNVFVRDNFCCQYCGIACTPKQLTYDHVLPRSRGGKTDWKNIVSACKPCNARKADMLCSEAKMWPINKPEKPKTLPYEPSIVDLETAPKEWLQYIS